MGARNPATENESRLSSLKDGEILDLRIKDLGLSLDQCGLREAVDQLYSELEAKGLPIRPAVYLGDEWFSPEGLCAIAIPFYLAHPRLKELERKLMHEVEGDTHEWLMKLLRHEAGHCFDHAYGLSKTRKFKSFFGSSSEVEYQPERYRSRPYSRSFVRHLDDWYSQSHPDEDFAETFAVWLTPDREWKKEYSKWKGALRKLEYIEEISNRVQGGKLRRKDEVLPPSRLPFQAKKMNSRLSTYYRKRRKSSAEDYPDFFDRDLQRIFVGQKEAPKRETSAARYLQRNRKTIVGTVGKWTSSRKYVVSQLVRRLEKRCQEIDLRVGEDSDRLQMDLAAYLASLVERYQTTGSFGKIH